MIGCHDVQSLLGEVGLKAKAVERIRTVEGASRTPEVFAVDREIIFKIYPSSLRGNCERERDVLSILEDHQIPAPHLLHYSSSHFGDWIATTRAPGVPLSSVYQQYDLAEYRRMLLALGAWIGRCHRVEDDRARSLTPLSRENFHGNEEHRRAQLDRFPEAVDCLTSQGVLTEYGARELSARIEQATPRMFSQPHVLSHGDIHNDHVFIEPTNGSAIACTLIDFETAAYQPQALDLVHPFLNIVGEAFPGRRFGSVDSIGEHPLLRSFRDGYRNGSSQDVDWELVAVHAIVWYFAHAMEAIQGKRRGFRGFYGRTALQAAAFVQMASLADLTPNPGRARG